MHTRPATRGKTAAKPRPAQQDSDEGDSTSGDGEKVMVLFNIAPMLLLESGTVVAATGKRRLRAHGKQLETQLEAHRRTCDKGILITDTAYGH